MFQYHLMDRIMRSYRIRWLHCQWL